MLCCVVLCVCVCVTGCVGSNSVGHGWARCLCSRVQAVVAAVSWWTVACRRGQPLKVFACSLLWGRGSSVVTWQALRAECALACWSRLEYSRHSSLYTSCRSRLPAFPAQSSGPDRCLTHHKMTPEVAGLSSERTPLLNPCLLQEEDVWVQSIKDILPKCRGFCAGDAAECDRTRARKRR